MKKLVLLLMVLIALPFASAVAAPSILVEYDHLGLTIVTGTISGDDVEGFPVTVFCQNDWAVFPIGADVSNNEGSFVVVYDNNLLDMRSAVCAEGDTVWAEIDDTEFRSRNVIVETTEVYDYADADIDVPEFGLLAGLVVLAGAGLFIYNRRK